MRQTTHENVPMPERLTAAQIFAKNLKRFMDRNPACDTQQKVSDRSRGRISQQHVGKLLKGLAAPTLETIDALSQAFGVHPFEFLVDNEEMRRRVFEGAIGPHVEEDPSQKVVPLRRKRK